MTTREQQTETKPEVVWDSEVRVSLSDLKFRRYISVHLVEARQLTELDHAQTQGFIYTFDGNNGFFKPGDYLIRGVSQDRWIETPEKFNSHFTLLGESDLMGWGVYRRGNAVEAAEVTVDTNDVVWIMADPPTNRLGVAYKGDFLVRSLDDTTAFNDKPYSNTWATMRPEQFHMNFRLDEDETEIPPNMKQYRKSAPVLARQLTTTDFAEMGGVIQTIEGHQAPFIPGDWIAKNPGHEDYYPITGATFAISKRLSDVQPESGAFKSYDTITPVYAEQQSEPFEIHMGEGKKQQGKAGDYLVQDDTGRQWIVDQTIFEETYTEVVADGDKDTVENS